METLTPRGVRDLIEQALRVGFGNFGKLFTIYGMFLGPFILVQILLSVDAGVSDGVSMIVFWVVYFLVGPIPAGAAVLVVTDAFVGDRTSVRECYRAAFSRGRELILLGWASALATGLSFMLFIVPGLYVLATVVVLSPVLVLERREAKGTWRRCRTLAHGRRFMILATVAALFAMALLPRFVAEFLVAMVLDKGLAFELIEQVINLVGTLFAGVASTCIYLDLRVRRDGLDADRLAEDVDLAVRAPVVPASAGTVT